MKKHDLRDQAILFATFFNGLRAIRVGLFGRRQSYRAKWPSIWTDYIIYYKILVIELFFVQILVA